MPSIDCSGKFFVRAYSVGMTSAPAIRFPVRASRISTASRFAEKVILAMLPGWDRGTIFLKRSGKNVATWDLYRKAKGK